jgi:hypothetical protein
MDRRVGGEDTRRVDLQRARQLCLAWVYHKRNEWSCRREDGHSLQWKRLKVFEKAKGQRPGIGVKHHLEADRSRTNRRRHETSGHNERAVIEDKGFHLGLKQWLHRRD